MAGRQKSTARAGASAQRGQKALERRTVTPDHRRQAVARANLITSPQVVGELRTARVDERRPLALRRRGTHHFRRLLEPKQLAIASLADAVRLVHADVNPLGSQRRAYGFDHLR